VAAPVSAQPKHKSVKSRALRLVAHLLYSRRTARVRVMPSKGTRLLQEQRNPFVCEPELFLDLIVVQTYSWFRKDNEYE
jgi:hypothetical protein